jgi:hypothetical protein
MAALPISARKAAKTADKWRRAWQVIQAFERRDDEQLRMRNLNNEETLIMARGMRLKE